MTKEEKKLAKQYVKEAQKTKEHLEKFNNLDSKIMIMELNWNKKPIDKVRPLVSELNKIINKEEQAIVKELLKSKLYIKTNNWIAGEQETEIVTIDDLVKFYIANKYKEVKE